MYVSYDSISVISWCHKSCTQLIKYKHTHLHTVCTVLLNSTRWYNGSIRAEKWITIIKSHLAFSYLLWRHKASSNQWDNSMSNYIFHLSIFHCSVCCRGFNTNINFCCLVYLVNQNILFEIRFEYDAGWNGFHGNTSEE